MWLPLMAILMGRGRRLVGDPGEADRFLLCQAIVPLAVFAMVACTRSVLPHWTLVGFLSLFPLLGRSWELRAASRPRFSRRLGLLGGGMMLAIGLGLFPVHSGLLQQWGRARLVLPRLAPH